MFDDVSSLIRTNPPALHYGAAVTDFDADGRPEFVVAGFGGPNRVLRWDGKQLWDIAPRSIADPDRQTLSLIAGDVDGDGREELYAMHADTFAGPKTHPDRLFDHDPTSGRWHDLLSQPANRTARNAVAGRSVAALDRRGTGRYGFFVANFDRPMGYYEMSGDGRFVDLAPALGLNLCTGGRGVWAGPLASDRIDILCVNEHGANFLFRNTGLGTFLEIAHDVRLADPDEHARGVTVLDADGDGRLDVVWGNWDGPHRLMLRTPDGRFRDRATPAMALPSRVRTVIAADFDNDGFEELFFNNLGEPNRLFRRVDGEWRLSDPGPATLSRGAGTGAAVADIDGDGVLELLVCHGEASEQPLALFKSAAAGHHWVRFAPVTRFGAPARGATVRLTSGGRTQVRVIDGGSGYLCQMEPVAHFGLGEVTNAESVRVTWPDGAEVLLRSPAVRATHRVEYPRG
jgi:hypothetical protein